LRKAILETALPATLSYIQAVEIADNQQLDNGTLSAVVNFANWRIPLGGACCLQSGPRTLAGKLVPMVGPAPIGVSLTEGDVSRWGGITGDGTGKYVRTQYDHLNLNQNSIHAGVWITNSHLSGFGGYIGAGNTTGGSSAVAIVRGDASWSLRCASTASQVAASVATSSTGPLIMARNLSTGFELRSNDGVRSITNSSAVLAQNREFYVLAQHTSLNVAATFSSATVGLYSVGPYIDPAEWVSRVNQLSAGLAAAADSTWGAGGGIPVLDLEF
jgi:hypothetical protein